MAQTINGTKQLEFYNVTLGTADNITKLTLPAKQGLLILTARTVAAKVGATTAVADGGAIGASAYKTLAAGTEVTLDVSGIGDDYVFLASTTSSAVVEVVWVGL